MEILTDVIEFDAGSQRFPRTYSKSVTFPSNVRQVAAFLSGFEVGFSNNIDHELGKIDVRIDASMDGSTVFVHATLGVRDWPEPLDDYEGKVYFVLIVDLYPKLTDDAVSAGTDGVFTG